MEETPGGLAASAQPFQPTSRWDNPTGGPAQWGTDPSAVAMGHVPASSAGGGMGGPNFAASGFAEASFGAEGMDGGADITAPLSVQPRPERRTLQSQFIPPDLEDHFRQQAACMLAELPPGDERLKEIPRGYTCVNPLDTRDSAPGPPSASSFGYPTRLYKVVSVREGHTYALRRIDKARTTLDIVSQAFEMWQRAPHPNMVPLRASFVHQGALFFAHDYCPGAQTLADKYLRSRGPPLPEGRLWSIIVQVASALRSVHSHRMAARVVSAQRILVTGFHRVRIANVGVMDVLDYENERPLQALQQEDLRGLGLLIVQLARRQEMPPSDMNQALDEVAQRYSDDMRRLVLLLLSGRATVFDACGMVSGRFMNELDSMYQHADTVENHLATTAENGRILSLLLKLGLVNERPEHQRDRRWAETGNRYLLSLFRDYAFHQQKADGSALVDLGHVLESLNKLDTGDAEQVPLMSRDKKNILLVSFQDLRYCLDESMSQLLGMSAPPRPGAEEQDSSARFTSSDGMYGGAGAGSNVMMMGGVPMGFMQQQGMAMQRAAMAAASGMATGAMPMMGSAPAPAGGHPEFGHAPHPPAMGMGHPAMGGGSGHPAMGGLMRSSSSGPVMGPGGMGMGPGGMGMGPSGVSDPLPRGYSQ